MKSKTFLATFVISLALGAPSVSAAPFLTIAHIFDGALDGLGYTWTTHSGGYFLFLSDDNPTGAIINQTGTQLNYQLSDGNNRFFFFGDFDRTPKTPPWGLVLGFDTPLSAFTIFADHTGIAALTTEGSSAYASQAITETWANSTTFAVDSFNIVLSDFNIFLPNITGVDRVSPFSAVGNGRDDAIGSFTLRVTSVPEPETYAMLLAGLGLLGFSTRHRKQKETV